MKKKVTEYRNLRVSPAATPGCLGVSPFPPRKGTPLFQRPKTVRCRRSHVGIYYRAAQQPRIRCEVNQIGSTIWPSRAGRPEAVTGHYWSNRDAGSGRQIAEPPERTLFRASENTTGEEKVWGV